MTPLTQEADIRDVRFGLNVRIVRPGNPYQCVIGDDSFVGPFIEIQRGATLDQQCRLQSHTLICEFVTIGNDCFIGHGVMFINDTMSSGGPAQGDRSKLKPTVIGSRVSIGSNATILPV